MYACLNSAHKQVKEKVCSLLFIFNKNWIEIKWANKPVGKNHGQMLVITLRPVAIHH